MDILKQFYDLKSENPEALILFRTGDFYETYSEDAEEVSKILGITLTKSSVRKDKDGEPLKLAAFPHHALDTYLPKLVRAGKRIAICEQIEDPGVKELVKRGSKELVSNN
jgi:DNA mismatch repair ATPase MutS